MTYEKAALFVANKWNTYQNVQFFYLILVIKYSYIIGAKSIQIMNARFFRKSQIKFPKIILAPGMINNLLM